MEQAPTLPAVVPGAGPGRRERVAVVLALAVAVAMALSSAARESATYDEPVHHRYGLQLLDGSAARFDDSKMPVSALNAVPARLARFLPDGTWKDRLADPRSGRPVTLLMLLGTLVLVWRWSRTLYGPAGGLASLALAVFDPNLLAHGRLVTTDLPLAAGVLLCLWTLRNWLVLGGRRRAVLAALAFGVAQVTKYTAVYLVPVLLLVALVHARGRVTREGLRRLAAGAALFAAAAVLVVNAAFLFERTLTPLAGYTFRSAPFQGLQSAAGPLAVLPVPLPYPYLEGLDWVLAKERDGVGYIWLLGELRGGKGFFGYFFWAFLLKVPLGMQALWLAGLATAVAGARRARLADGEVFLVVPSVFFLAYFMLLSQAQWGIRFLLLAFPTLHVLAGGLLADAAGAGQRRVRLAVAATTATVAMSVLSWHPHPLSYFNELVRPRAQAWRYLADSNLDWGQNQWYLDRWLEAHPEARVEPRAPRAGLVVVGVNKLVGVFNPPRYRWLRENFTPVETVAYTWLVYDVPAERLRALGLEGGAAEGRAR